MSASSTLIRVSRIAGSLTCLLGCLVAAGCVGVDRGRPQNPPQSAPQPATQPGPAPPEATEVRTAPTPPPPIAPLPPPAPTPTPVVRSPASGTTAAAKPAAPTRPPSTVAVVPERSPVASKPIPPAVAPKPTPPPLDLSSLEARLRDTKAIGVFTKLSLKNQVDDLLNKFRAYYKRQTRTTLAELRRPYDMLLLKVLFSSRTVTRRSPVTLSLRVKRSGASSRILRNLTKRS